MCLAKQASEKLSFAPIGLGMKVLGARAALGGLKSSYNWARGKTGPVGPQAPRPKLNINPSSIETPLMNNPYKRRMMGIPANAMERTASVDKEAASIFRSARRMAAARAEATRKLGQGMPFPAPKLPLPAPAHAPSAPSALQILKEFKRMAEALQPKNPMAEALQPKNPR